MFVPASKLNGFGEQIGIYVQEDTSKYQLFVVIWWPEEIKVLSIISPRPCARLDDGHSHNATGISMPCTQILELRWQICVVNTRMRAEDRPPNGSCRLKIDRSGKVCMYVSRTHINRDILGSWYSWISGPSGLDMKGWSHPWISWGRYPITRGAGTDTCFSPWISNGYHGVKAPPPPLIESPPYPSTDHSWRLLTCTQRRQPAAMEGATAALPVTSHDLPLSSG
jgi:hypothetical protein